MNDGFPDKQVIFVDGAGGDALWGVDGEGFVFLEEAFGGDCVHFWFWFLSFFGGGSDSGWGGCVVVVVVVVVVVIVSK